MPQWWNNKSSAATATPVAVTAGGPVNGISAKLADAGSISGTVTDASSNAPLNGICVFVYPNGSSSSLPGFKTNSSGVYTASQLAPGSYKVEFSDCAGGGHAGQFWNNKPSLSTATLVTVTAGATASGINAKLVAGGNISGTVSSSSGPLAGICVFPFQTGQTSSLAGTTTDSQGKYTLTGLAGGVTYQIQFQDCATGTYAGQWYNNQPSQATANSVSAGTAGVNATMVQAGAFSGLVTNSANAGLAGICVWAFPDPSTSATGVKTDSTGHYTFGGLKPGNYRVEFQDCAGGGHTTQWWNSQPDFNSASLITVTAGQTAPNINARLT